MLRRVLLGLLALLVAGTAQAQTYRPGFAPGFRPGFQFVSSLPSYLATYDFAGGTYPTVTLTRASTGLAQNLAGTWLSFAADTLRRTNRGALIELAATNGVRNATMQGAAAGTPGTLPTNWAIATSAGLSSQVVGTGTEAGLDYVDLRFFGTASSTTSTIYFEAAQVITASSGQTRTTSATTSLVGGSMANVTGLSLVTVQYTGTTAGTGSVAAASATASPVRTSVTRTIDAGDSVRPGFRLGLTNGGAVDVTVRVAVPQEEQNAVGTSPIKTTGTAVTRAADAASITVPAGVGTIRYAFDDSTTQDVSVSAGSYSIPTTFAPKMIARMDLLAGGGGGGSANPLYDFTTATYANGAAAPSVSRATSAYVEDASGNLTLVAANTLRRSNKGALIEPAATNLVFPSIPGANWGTYRSTITQNNGTDPLGGTTASTIALSEGSTDVSPAYRNLTNSAGAYAASAYIKGTAGQKVYFHNGNGQRNSVTFTGAWQRVTTLDPAAAANSIIYFDTRDRFSATSHLPAVTFLAWHCGFEAGSSASSIIPTTTASAARAADAVTITIPTGYTQGVFTLDDNTTQTVTGLSAGSYTLPTGYAPKYIKTLELRP